MPLIKLNRINKGGAICVNSDEILFVEVEYRTTTIHMAHNLLFSVEESLDAIVSQIDNRAADSIALGINKSGLVVKNSEAAAEKPSPTPPAIA